MNKTRILLAVSVLALGLFTTQAQTGATAAGTNDLPKVADTLSVSALGGLAHTIGDQIAGISFKDGYSVNPFMLYHKGDMGGGVSVHTANTNGLRLGLALAAVDEHDPNVTSVTHGGKTAIFNKGKGTWNFYDATVSIGAKGNFTVPLVNWKLDLYLESGPAFNLRDPNTVYIQSVAGATKSWALGKGVLTIGGGIGHNSRWNDGPFYIAHAGYTF